MLTVFPKCTINKHKRNFLRCQAQYENLGKRLNNKGLKRREAAKEDGEGRLEDCL